MASKSKKFNSSPKAYFTPRYFTPADGSGRAPQANPYRRTGSGGTQTFDGQDAEFVQISGAESQSLPTPEPEPTQTRRFLPQALSRFERSNQFQSREPSEKFFTPVSQGESLGQFGQRVTNRDLQNEFQAESNRRQQSLEPNAFIGSPTAQAIIDRQEGGIFGRNTIRNTPDFQALSTRERFSLIGRDLVAGEKRVAEKVGGIITFDRERFDRASDKPLGAFGSFSAGLAEGAVTASFIPQPAIKIKPNSIITQDISDLKFKTEVLDIGKQGGRSLQIQRATSIGDNFPTTLNSQLRVNPLDDGGAAFEGFANLRRPGLKATNKGLLNEDFVITDELFKFEGTLPPGEKTVNALAPVRFEGSNTLLRGFTELKGGLPPKGTQTFVSREVTSLEGNRISFENIGKTTNLRSDLFGEKEFFKLDTNFGSYSKFQGASGEPKLFAQKNSPIQDVLQGRVANKGVLSTKFSQRESIKLENPFEPTNFVRGNRIRFKDTTNDELGFSFKRGRKSSGSTQALLGVQQSSLGGFNFKPSTASVTKSSPTSSLLLGGGGSSTSIYAGTGQYERTSSQILQAPQLRGGFTGSILEPPRLTQDFSKVNNFLSFNNLGSLTQSTKSKSRFSPVSRGSSNILDLQPQRQVQNPLLGQPTPTRQREDLLTIQRQTFKDDFFRPPTGFSPRGNFGGGRGFNFGLGLPGGELVNSNPKRRTGNRKFKRTPSLVSLELGIYSTKQARGEISGLVARPILRSSRKRRKR